MIGKPRLQANLAICVSPWGAAAEQWEAGEGQAWGAARERGGVGGPSLGNADG